MRARGHLLQLYRLRLTSPIDSLNRSMIPKREISNFLRRRCVRTWLGMILILNVNLIACAANPSVAYITSEGGKVSVLDLEKLEIVKEKDLAAYHPRGLAVTRDGRFLLTANKGTADVAVIDATNLEIVKTIPIGANPEFLKAHPTGRWILTSHEPGAEGGPPKVDSKETKDEQREDAEVIPSRIVALETQQWRVTKEFPGGVETEGLEFSVDGRYLLAANEAEDTVRIYDFESGAEKKRIDLHPYGERPRGVKRSPDGQLFVVTLEISNNLVLLDKNFDVLRTIPTGESPYGVAFDREGKRLLVAAARSRKLQIFDTNSWELLAETAIGARCWHFSFTPDDKKILIACGRSNDVHVLDANTYETLKVIGGFTMPWAVVTFPLSYGSLDLP